MSMRCGDVLLLCRWLVHGKLELALSVISARVIMQKMPMPALLLLLLAMMVVMVPSHPATR